jgi:hypothetical protein
VAVAVLCLVAIIALKVATTDSTPKKKASDVAAVSTSDRALLDKANQILIRDCMRQHGFDYWPIAGDPTGGALPFPYVITSEQWAAVNGVRGYSAPSNVPDSNESYFKHLSTGRQDQYSDTLVGPSSGHSVSVTLPSGGILGHSADGCQAQAATELYGDFQAWFQASSVSRDLKTVWQRAVMTDDRYRAAVQDWSTCIKRDGFAYRTPAEVAGAFSQRPLSTRPSTAETAVATAEARCAVRTGLADVVRRLDQEHSTTVRRRYQHYVDLQDRLERDALPQARRIVSSAPSIQDGGA